MGQEKLEYSNLSWVNPRTIEYMVIPGIHGFLSRSNCGESFGGPWDLEVIPIKVHPKAIYCKQRWEQGLPWEQTLAHEFYARKIELRKEYDKCRNMSDVQSRLNRLDEAFEKICKDGHLNTRFSMGLTRHPNDESGGVYFHLGRALNPIFSGGGFHRLMMAKILEFNEIPIQIGIVHSAAKIKLKSPSIPVTKWFIQ